MNKQCQLYQALIPQYQDNLLDEEAKALLEEHLETCEDCQAFMLMIEGEGRNYKLSETEEVRGFKKLQRNLRTQRYFTIITSVLVTTIFLLSLWNYLTAPTILPYQDNLVEVHELSDDQLLVVLDDSVADYELYDSSAGELNLTAYTNILYQQQDQPEKKSVLIENASEVDNIYLVQGGQDEDRIIYGNNPYPNGGRMTLPRLALAYYVKMVVLTLLIGLAGLWWSRRQGRSKLLLQGIMSVSVSFILATLLVTGLSTSTYTLVRDFSMIIMLTIPISILIINLILHREAKKERDNYTH